jgi:hypothetical protein
MDQLEMKMTGGMAASIEDRGGMRPVSRARTVAVRGTTGPSALCLAARPRQESLTGTEPAPVWLAALMAVNCQARSNGLHHDICWHAVAGRAVYTNFGNHAENIEPLGVSLPAGDTLAVYWSPGETAYTVEVYSDREKCA